MLVYSTPGGTPMKRAIVLISLLVVASCVPIAPPPPVLATGPAAPAPVAHTYTVYFSWNRSWVGSPGMAILQQAAAAYRAGGVVTVQVTGYTDTSGSPGYNQRLSG